MSNVVYTTSDQAGQLHGVKLCVHGRGGVGKTTLIQTLPDPIIISAESGMLALRHIKIPCLTINTIAGLEEAYNFVAFSTHARQFQSVALDSISELAEVCLADEFSKTADGRKAYGEYAQKMTKWIKKFRDLPNKHVYFSAKQGWNQDEITKVTRYAPDMPGKTLTTDMPYLFDEVFSLEIGKTQAGQEFRFLRTKPDVQYDCKDRSGALDSFEEPHLGKVIEKILATPKAV
jgi:hypothetical protein